MSWEQEYEHLRDKGKTWGPGIDDAVEPTDKELIDRRVKREAYRKKLDDAAIAPREEFVVAGEELKNRYSTDEIFRSSSLMKEFCGAQMELCKKACELLGYKFDFPDQVWGLG